MGFLADQGGSVNGETGGPQTVTQYAALVFRARYKQCNAAPPSIRGAMIQARSTFRSIHCLTSLTTVSLLLYLALSILYL